MKARSCLLLLSACMGGEPEPLPSAAPLDRFAGFALAIEASDDRLFVDLTNTHYFSAYACPQLLPSFVATLDGRPMAVERGYVANDGIDSPDYRCVTPHASTMLRGQRLHIADETLAYDIDLGDATALRTMVLPTTTLTRGGSVEVSWSSAADLGNTAVVDAHLVLRTIYRVDAVIVDGRVRVTLPSAAELQASGNGTLRVRVRSVRPCPHVNCTIAVEHEAVQAVTVQ